MKTRNIFWRSQSTTSWTQYETYDVEEREAAFLVSTGQAVYTF